MAYVSSIISIEHVYRGLNTRARPIPELNLRIFRPDIKMEYVIRVILELL